MKCYIYQADIYCEDCGQNIANRLGSEGDAPAIKDDEGNLLFYANEDMERAQGFEDQWDSDDFPKGPYPVSESDSPQHCACGADCINRLALDNEGNEVTSDSKVINYYGCFLGNDLTEHGIEWLIELYTYVKPNPVSKFWAIFYRDILEN